MTLLPSNLKLLRRMHGLTQGELARLIGKSNKAVRDYESGFSEPKSAILLKLSEILKVSIHELLSKDFNNHPIILLELADNESGIVLDPVDVESFLEATNLGQKIQDGLTAFDDFNNELDITHFEVNETGQQLLLILQELLSANWSLIDEMTNISFKKKDPGVSLINTPK